MLSEDTNSPATDILCLNAGAALYTNDLVESLADGIKLARATLREGKVRQKLADIVAWSHAQK
ncbi:hypothetical protein KSB_47340 [Ktedonobacter robiniae]|uniref:Anthranilate phosphoribosyltransferase n=1 Tax=Ktedonobacter robiniae TaxID=2778365 RepID=A0ABQ3UU92_9CHLR|nr:hypothetical protein KSB_47340 [Ktedonobacter robiniae]